MVTRKMQTQLPDGGILYTALMEMTFSEKLNGGIVVEYARNKNNKNRNNECVRDGGSYKIDGTVVDDKLVLVDTTNSDVIYCRGEHGRKSLKFSIADDMLAIAYDFQCSTHKYPQKPALHDLIKKADFFSKDEIENKSESELRYLYLKRKHDGDPVLDTKCVVYKVY